MSTVTRYDHLVYDWNGTLFDDAVMCVDIINAMLERRNIPRVTMLQYQEQFGFPVRDYYLRVGFDFDAEPFEILAKEFITAYEQRRLECSLQQQALHILQWCQQRQIPQSILSAYRQPTLDELVEHYGLTGYFEHIVGLDDYYAATKVHTGKRLLDELQIPPDRVLLIGDTTHDHEVADEIGIQCVLIPSGHNTPDRLAACNVPVLESLLQLPDFLADG